MLQFIIFMMTFSYVNPIFASSSDGFYVEDERTQTKTIQASNNAMSENLIQEFDYGNEQLAVYHSNIPVHLVIRTKPLEGENGDNYFSKIYKRLLNSTFPKKENSDDRIGTLTFEFKEEDAKDFPSSIYIKWIEIDPKFQNKGYGTSILKVFLMALNNNQDWEFSNFILNVELNNPRAKHVYEKLGFEEMIEKTTDKTAYMKLKRTKLIHFAD